MLRNNAVCSYAISTLATCFTKLMLKYFNLKGYNQKNETKRLDCVHFSAKFNTTNIFSCFLAFLLYTYPPLQGYGTHDTNNMNIRVMLTLTTLVVHGQNPINKIRTIGNDVVDTVWMCLQILSSPPDSEIVSIFLDQCRAPYSERVAHIQQNSSVETKEPMV